MRKLIIWALAIMAGAYFSPLTAGDNNNTVTSQSEVMITPDDSVSYSLGLGIGLQLKQMGAENLNLEDFTNAIRDIFADNQPKISIRDAQRITTTYFKEKEEKEKAEREAKAKAAKEEGEKFLKENTKKKGVVTLPSGLQYRVIRKGKGPMPKEDDMVTVKYEGRLIDGTVFDSSYKRTPQTNDFRPKQLIKGWTEALTHMPVGSKWEIYVPQELGYGERQAGQIPPYSTLIFVMELEAIK